MYSFDKPQYVFEGGNFIFTNVGDKDKRPFSKRTVIMTALDRDRFVHCFLPGEEHQYEEMHFDYEVKGPFLKYNAIPQTAIGRVKLITRSGAVTVLYVYIATKLYDARNEIQGEYFGQQKVYPKSAHFKEQGPLIPAPVQTGGADAFLKQVMRDQPPQQVYPLGMFPAHIYHNSWVYIFISCREGNFSLLPGLERVAQERRRAQMKRLNR